MVRTLSAGRRRRRRRWSRTATAAPDWLLADWRWTLGPWGIAVAGAIAYLIVAPDSTDLAAHVFRAELFERAGLAVWNNQWYGGHHTLSYSLLFPPLAALLGPRAAGAIGAVLAAALFAALVRGAWPASAHRTWPAAWWFAAASVTLLLTGRLTFALGVAVGLGALLAAQRARPVLATALAIATPLASPVAGLFLALAGLAWGLAGPRRLTAALVAGASFGVAVAMAALFPEGGTQPFALSSFWPVPAFCAVAFVLLPREERALRVGAVLYGIATIAAFALDTPMGGNAVRLGALFGGPVLAAALLARGGPAWWTEAPVRARRPATDPVQPLRGRSLGGPRPGRGVGDPLYRARRQRDWRLIALVALLAPLLWWQWQPAVRDVRKAHGDPAVQASYYAPLLGFLARQGEAPFRVEIPFTLNHWEAAHVAPEFPLARGWQRQLDVRHHQLFYDGELNAQRYREWLDEHGVRFVALPDARLDYTAQEEARLIRGGLPYLRPVWSDAHWRVFEVRDWAGMTEGPATMTSLGPDTVGLRAAAPGRVLVRVRYSPYWAVVAGSGCVSEAPGGWTRLDVRRAGTLRLALRVDPRRVVSGGERCSDG